MQFLTITQLNLYQTLEELEKLNSKSGITTDVTWLEYLDSVYANATTFDILSTSATKYNNDPDYAPGLGLLPLDDATIN